MKMSGSSCRDTFLYMCCVLALLLNVCYVDSSAVSASYSGLSSQTEFSNENDEDYTLQKENVLEKSYHGLIRENETLVEITPIIKVDEEKICSFRILKKPYHEIPFEIELLNNLAILKARHMLNCEKRKSYHFEIVAVFCDGSLSSAANVHITVIDINEYAPTFLQPSYVTEVDEAYLYKEIIRLEAMDKDCTPLYGDVCKYEILNNDQPFSIDNEGSIKNTKPLNHKTSHNHILSVVAYDCAMKMSAPVMVNIKVRSLCTPKINGIMQHINYTPVGTKGGPLFPNAHLELCDMYCDNQSMNIHTFVVLKTNHISFGCDRDALNCSNLNDENKKSGKNEGQIINLLPKQAEWTKNLTFDEGPEPIFHFDGSSGVFVPEKVMSYRDFSSQPFSIITVFRHSAHAHDHDLEPDANHDSKHIKEHILCSADDHKMNRHHMALFVRNCRLILLLRKNFNEGDLNIFSPAEWRWKIPQVCDNEWHHYVLNVDDSSSPKIELFIDGVRFKNAHEDRHSNPEVIDDWPLHAAQGVNTKLVVGACFQSSDQQLRHGFVGDVSIVRVALNNVLSPNEIKCLTDCAEHLVAPDERLLTADTQLQVNTQLNEIYIEGQRREHVEQLLRNVRYVNSKQQPTIGRRNIEVRSTVMCVNQSAIRLPLVEAYIMVNTTSTIATSEPPVIAPPMPHEEWQKSSGEISTQGPIAIPIEVNDDIVPSKQNKILIKGDANKLVTYPEIKRGVHILADLNFTFANSKTNESGNKYRLNACNVVVFPSLNPDHEDISVLADDELANNLNIKTNINKEGVEMFGNDILNNYLSVLRALVYSNKKPAYYLNRVFKLTCNQLLANQAMKSGEYTLTLTVLHPKQTNLAKSTSAPIMEVPTSENMLLYETDHGDKIFSHAMIHNHDAQESQFKLHSNAHKADTTHPTMLIGMICLFAIILLCGIFVARLRNNRTSRHQPCPKIVDESLTWDDSALTITINPMQSDVISEDSTDSENSESDDEDVMKARFPNVNQLEWDNSNIFTSH